MQISLFTKKAVYENTFIGDFPEPDPKKCNCFGSGSGQKGQLRLRNTDFYLIILIGFVVILVGFGGFWLNLVDFDGFDGFLWILVDFYRQR